jgi:glycosyltransferase involved in cell wall biosynthesis
MPLISVVIPTYNRAARLPACLASVRAAGLRDAEIIVVDDGSTDDTAAVVRAHAPSATYVFQANAGPSAARNRGVKAARGGCILFLDSDDQILPGIHAPLVDFMGRHPAVGVIFTDSTITYEDGTSERAFARKDNELLHQLPSTLVDGIKVFDRTAFLRALVLDHCFIPVISVIRRAAYEGVGGFDQSLIGYEEWDLFAKLAASSSIGYLDSVGANIEKHGSNLSGNHEAMITQGIVIVERFLNGSVPLADEDRPALLEKLRTMMFGSAYFALVRGAHRTARERLAAYVRRWRVSPLIAAYWCATWLPAPFVSRLRGWKSGPAEDAPRQAHP